jgi:acetyl esterase/lipase
MKIRSVWILSITITFLVACTNITEIVDPNNTYTPETTFQKLIGEYPFIGIASREVPPSVTEIKNLTYVRYGNRALQLDLYLPKNKIRQKNPAIIFIHGGGWRAGYRTNFTPFAIAMAERGYAAATISYRLSPEAQYPAAIQDAKAAIRWLRQNAKTYHINPNQIAIAGGSAGGQIASLTGVTEGVKKFDPALKKSRLKKSSNKVQAIINIDGLSDFTSEAALFYEDDPKKNPSAAGAWFGGRYHEKSELWREASPVFYVDENTPPILFLISNQERFSLGHKDMIAKMEPLNIPYQVTQIPNTPHSFWLFDPWLQPSVEAVVNFLNTQFALHQAKQSID